MVNVSGTPGVSTVYRRIRVTLSALRSADVQQSRPDRLLRAAVSAYCSLTRPGRQDAIQLQDLALPLIDGASRDTLRYISAALSLCEIEPPALVSRLSDMSVDIAAPVLARSTSIKDIDLIDLIGRHGLRHASVIATRANLHPSVRHLTNIVEERRWNPASAVQAAISPSTVEDTSAPYLADQRAPLAVEETRDRLRTIMQATRQEGQQPDVDYIYEDLRESVLSGSLDQFAAALANALGVVMPMARTIASDATCTQLIPALRALGLLEEEAFLIVAAAFPMRFAHASQVRSFLKRYRDISFEQIEVQLTGWQDLGEAVTATRRAG